MSPGTESKTFRARPEASREARRFVEQWLDDRGLIDFVDRVPLAVSELATNAVLHTSKPFTIAVGGNHARVRVEAVDSAPESVPVASKRDGIVADITGLSETGRGLLITGALANRWGMDLTAAVKTIWCEFDESGQPTATTEPIINDQRPPHVPQEGLAHLHFIGLPVRTAIASGFDVEDAIRDVRVLSDRDAVADPDAVGQLLDLVERSVTARLAGRHAAMEAAGESRYRFDLIMDVTDDALLATAQLAILLAQRVGGSREAPPDAVVVFRSWVSEETIRQRQGHAPTPCPLPD